MKLLIRCVALVFLVASPAFADIVTLPNGDDVIPVDENLNPFDFADSFATPSAVGVFGIGDTIVEGTILNASESDEDVFTFTIADGTRLDSITLDYITGDGNHFVGIDTGTSMTFPASYDGTSLLVAHLVSDLDSGADLLTIDVASNNYNTIAPPGALSAGDYSVWIRETEFQDFDYSLTFRVSAVAIPEPSSLVALLGILATTCVTRRRN
ncbi:PEP-CTERM sorting domain-containing protein [Stieleria sp. JC731]|uniref:PEP-CTERM sorting domain-containing protein n=1 Tax=Pirellulaceae TaxID=2691357 RepID=UPI001E62398A|nr:PEP-CTERM sorting domain-containing protein [Stieleria sp. JC731]MCC9603445.1 PEP-CTERM sorting domain-containing protein [Stieleria sp. JC731]